MRTLRQDASIYTASHVHPVIRLRQKHLLSTQRGFTIVELLIVIIVIAILAAIVIVAFNGVQTKAQQSKIQADIRAITGALRMARDNKQMISQQITGSFSTGSACWSKPDGTNLATLPNTDTCISQYNTSMQALANASGVTALTTMRDPWGRPYLIDENEGEGGGCNHDTVAVYKQPFTTGFGAYSSTPTYNIVNSGYSGCTT